MFCNVTSQTETLSPFDGWHKRKNKNTKPEIVLKFTPHGKAASHENWHLKIILL